MIHFERKYWFFLIASMVTFNLKVFSEGIKKNTYKLIVCNDIFPQEKSNICDSKDIQDFNNYDQAFEKMSESFKTYWNTQINYFNECKSFEKSNEIKDKETKIKEFSLKIFNKILHNLKNNKIKINFLNMCNLYVHKELGEFDSENVENKKYLEEFNNLLKIFNEISSNSDQRFVFGKKFNEKYSCHSDSEEVKFYFFDGEDCFLLSNLINKQEKLKK